jgi:Tol biopolymer transport system component
MRIALAALAVGLVAGMGGGVTASAAPNEFSPFVFQLAWSPNGKWLASATNAGAEGSSVSVVRMDRAVQRRVVAVTPPFGTIDRAVWSPDSKQLAVVGWDSAGRVTTWVSSANGLGLRRFDGYFQDWSPDSRSFLVSREGGTYVVDSRTGAARFLVQGNGADWSPDGTRIAFSVLTRRTRCISSSESRIFSVNPDGTDRRQLGGDGLPFTHQRIAGWAPDSSRLVYYESSSSSSSSCELPATRGAFMVPADGSRQAAEIGHGAYAAAWSPRGRRLAVQEGMGRLRIVTPDGATGTTIARRTAAFGWGPNGGSIVFSAGRGGGTRGRIYAARADGKGQPRPLGRGAQPTWSTLGWIAFVSRGSCPGDGQRVYVVRPNGSRLHALSRCRPTR